MFVDGHEILRPDGYEIRMWNELRTEEGQSAAYIMTCQDAGGSKVRRKLGTSILFSLRMVYLRLESMQYLSHYFSEHDEAGLVQLVFG